MKTGIYISALGKALDRNSVERYAERFKNEMNFNTMKSLLKSSTADLYCLEFSGYWFWSSKNFL